MTAAKKHIGVIILAAGASSRLGSPKQLLPYAGNTLLEYIVHTAIDSMARPVVVVLGADADRIKHQMGSNAAQTIVNTDWKEGMASSIRCGVNALVQTDPLTDGTVIVVCDQPYITSALLNGLVTEHIRTGKSIIASSYDDTLGVPALFHKSIFPRLLQLSGESGAKHIIQQHSDELGVVVFSKGSVDIDTVEDYRKLSQSNHLS